ncbi:biotin-dependent carboxyltransferase family protein [Halobacillus sp. A5]|uniref:5-oxoprolinase subunit C family protein n=1 Tax=Halobacillus sp. A5 TaxID=2880263 RepID=UPI0020A672E0|nr:biotin-dependent carboxyltransferase family protein [Halobacillus sp. A5]MCP3028032.1 biotin-dependent carboxyltransferase family protein [Halobacillus sp. A5]
MMKIIKDGLLTLVQDLGRTGYQKYGVIASGSMDTFAHRIGNLLVGNEEKEAVIEVTLLGPVIEFHEDAVLSICGGDLSPAIDNEEITMWKPILVKKGAKLTFGKPRTGCRAYIAIAGGLDIPVVMGSRSTYMRAKIGGHNGRALQTEDVIHFKESFNLDTGARSFVEKDWTVARSLIPEYSHRPTISLIEGPQFSWFDEKSLQTLFSTSFKVSSQSDRMGFRMEGESLSLKEPRELISEAVSFGSIQVPNDGNPIILLADRQTTGGYPKIGQVASIDLPILCQMKPGEQLRFKQITLEEAQKAWLDQEHSIQLLKRSISLKKKEESS